MEDMMESTSAFCEEADRFIAERKELQERNRELALDNERLRKRLHYAEEAVEAMRPKSRGFQYGIWDEPAKGPDDRVRLYEIKGSLRW